MRGSLRRVGTSLFLASLLLACSLTIPGGSSPEPEYRYDDLPNRVNESSAISEYRAISTWDKLDITYTFVNGTNQLEGDGERDLIRRAFALWADQTELTFSEVAGNAADIVIGWAVGDHGDGDPFDGPGDILAHASFPNPYDNSQVFLHFDDDERWVDSDTRNVDLLTVAAHEIGHTLGLAHSNDPDALMFPNYSGPRRFLSDDDIAGVQSLYGVGSAPEPAPENRVTGRASRISVPRSSYHAGTARSFANACAKAASRSATATSSAAGARRRWCPTSCSRPRARGGTSRSTKRPCRG